MCKPRQAPSQGQRREMRWEMRWLTSKPWDPWQVLSHGRPIPQYQLLVLSQDSRTSEVIRFFFLNDPPKEGRQRKGGGPIAFKALHGQI